MPTFQDAERPYDAPSPQRRGRRSYIDPVNGPQPSDADYDYPDDRPSAAEQARMDWIDSHPDGRPEYSGQDFIADYAAARLGMIEEGCLRGLASLGYNPSVDDLAEFCSGFAHATITTEQTKVALFVLDALGWASPENGIPLIAGRWFITTQGRIALEGRP